MPGAASANASAKGKPSDTVRPGAVLFVRNIPPDFDQARCEKEFSQFVGFTSFKLLEKGKGSGFLTYDSVGNATQAKEEFEKSILKVTFKGSTVCDECGTVATKWINCICKGNTYCSPRCLINNHKGGHAADCVQPPNECRCILGRRYPGAIRCVCQRLTWCNVKCMEQGLDAHESNCIPRRFIPPAVMRKFRQNRDEQQNVTKLRTKMQDMKKEMTSMSTNYEKQLKQLQSEIQKLKLSQRAPNASTSKRAPAQGTNAGVSLSAELMQPGQSKAAAEQDFTKDDY